MKKHVAILGMGISFVLGMIISSGSVIAITENSPANDICRSNAATASLCFLLKEISAKEDTIQQKQDLTNKLLATQICLDHPTQDNFNKCIQKKLGGM